MARPKKPEGEHYETKVRSVRVPDDIWEAAQRRAKKLGTSVSAEVVAHLEKFGRPERTHE